MPSVATLILNCGRVCLALLVLSATIFGTYTRAQTSAPIAAQIAELERAVALYETTARTGEPDQQREMQSLLSMAQLATLYMRADRPLDDPRRCAKPCLRLSPTAESSRHTPPTGPHSWSWVREVPDSGPPCSAQHQAIVGPCRGSVQHPDPMDVEVLPNIGIGGSHPPGGTRTTTIRF